MDNFWEEASKAKHDMTINEWLGLQRQKRAIEHKAYESPKIFDTGNPYGPSGVYDERAIPNPYHSPKEQK